MNSLPRGTRDLRAGVVCRRRFFLLRVDLAAAKSRCDHSMNYATLPIDTDGSLAGSDRMVRGSQREIMLDLQGFTRRICDTCAGLNSETGLERLSTRNEQPMITKEDPHQYGCWTKNGPYEYAHPDGWTIVNRFVSGRPRWTLCHGTEQFGAFARAEEAMKYHAGLAKGDNAGI